MSLKAKILLILAKTTVLKQSIQNKKRFDSNYESAYYLLQFSSVQFSFISAPPHERNLLVMIEFPDF